MCAEVGALRDQFQSLEGKVVTMDTKVESQGDRITALEKEMEELKTKSTHENASKNHDTKHFVPKHQRKTLFFGGFPTDTPRHDI
eukprot:1578107-Karenia_brevis.AAC.1